MPRQPPQGLDGRFGDGQTESQGKYSAKEGSKADSLRPQTHMQVNPFLFKEFDRFFIQPMGKANGESETKDRSLSNVLKETV